MESTGLESGVGFSVQNGSSSLRSPSSKDFCDNTDESNFSPEICLVIQGEEIVCHKQLLIEHSRYFKAMFSSSMQESVSKKVELKELSVESVRCVIQFMKTGEITLNADYVHCLVQAACMLQVDPLLTVCCSFLISDLDPSNCLSTMLLADVYSLQDVYNKARVYALWYFSDVFEEAEFVELEKKQVIEYLSDEMLNVGSDEFSVVLSLEKWVSHDKLEREKNVDDLLKCVHFGSIPTEKLESWETVTCMKESSFKALRDIQSAQKDFQSRRKVPEVILSVGGNIMSEDDILPTTEVTRLDINSGTFVPYSDIQDVYPTIGEDPGYCVCVMGKDIYITGGEAFLGKNTWLMSVWCFNSFTKKWNVVTELTQPRRHHGTCTVGDSFYLIGGFGRFRTMLRSCEQYNVATGVWTTLPKLKCKAISPGVTVHQQRIYVIKTDIQCYELGTNTWTIIQLNESIGPHFKQLLCGDARNLETRIYVCNSFGPHFTILDPSAEDLNAGDVYCFPSAQGKAVVMDGKLFRDGGETCNNIECYNPLEQKFKLIGSRDSCLQRNNLVVIPHYPDFR